MNQFKFPVDSASPLSAPPHTTDVSPTRTTSRVPGYSGAVDEAGKPHGFGTQRYSDGSRYEGQFMHGELHGTGTYRYASGASYVGHFLKGKREGKGTYHFACGTVYMGDYKNDKREGHGRIRFSEAAGTAIAKQAAAPSGSLVAQLLGRPQSYEGDFEANAMQGRGTVTFASGAKYTGGMSGNQPHDDHGVLVAPNGVVHLEGKFSGGLPVGQCTLIHTQDTNKAVTVIVDSSNGQMTPRCASSAEGTCTLDEHGQCRNCHQENVVLGWLQATAASKSFSRPRSAHRVQATTFVGETMPDTPPRTTARATPSDLSVLRRLWDNVLTTVTICKHATHVGFGMAVADCKVKNSSDTVVRVVQIAPKSPAANHGFVRGDYIHSVNGHPIRTAQDFAKMQLVPGDVAHIVATRREHFHDLQTNTISASPLSLDTSAAVGIKAIVGCTLVEEDYAMMEKAAAEALQAMLSLDRQEIPVGEGGNPEYVTRLAVRLSSFEQAQHPRVWSKRSRN